MNSWKDNTAYCARRHKYGPIQSLADEAREAGEPSWIVGVAVTVLAIAAGVAVITGAFALRAEPHSRLVADAHQSPIAEMRK